MSEYQQEITIAEVSLEHTCVGRAATENSSAFQKVLDSMQGMASLSSIMRMLGSLFLIAGMSVFLLQGWGESTDSSRFLIMLSQTLLMSVAGFGLHFLLKENKGARVFFGLSLLSVTANFAVLGALIYSVVQFDNGLQGLPDFATWVMTDIGSLTFCILVGALVLVPVSFFGFRLFARGNTKKFATIYLVVCSLILLPVREPAIILGLIFLAVVIVTKMLRNLQGANTLERKIAIGGMFVPLVIMGFRSLYFYQVEVLTVLSILGFSYYGIRKLTCKRNFDSRLKAVANLISLPLAVSISISFFEWLSIHISDESWTVLLTVMTFCSLMVDLVLRSQKKPYSSLFSAAGCLALALGFTLTLSINDSLIMILLAIIASVSWAAMGYFSRSRTMIVSGLLIAGAVFVSEFVSLLTIIDLNNWLLLSILGASAIVIASVTERHGATLKLRFEKLFDDLKQKELSQE